MTITSGNHRFVSSQKAGLISIAVIFLLCSLYFQPNIGGEGLFLTYNISIWIGIALSISLAIFLTIRDQIFTYTRFWPGLLAFPLCVITSGYIADTLTPVEWLFRQLYIIAGVTFLFGLFQFRWSNRDLDRLLYILLFAGLIQAIYGSVQLIWPGNISPFLAPSASQPYGIFQQINLQASFQATSLLIALYAITRPSFKSQQVWKQLLVLVCIFTSSYMVARVGSRVGIVGALIGILAIISGRYLQFKANKFIIPLILVLISGGAWLGKSGLLSSYSKFADLTGDLVAIQGTATRKNIYAIGIDLTLQKPLVGHGIGSFQQVWQDSKADFLEQHPHAAFPPSRLSHPHNEILFWSVEGGLVALSGLLIAAATVIYAAFQCGWRRGITYLGLMFPIGLHTQVELPFYISSLHWALFLLLFFLVLQHHRRSKQVNLSIAATKSIQVCALLIFIGTAGFMYSANKGNDAIVAFLDKRMSDLSLLQPAMDNTYFNETAELYLMRTLMLRSLQANNYDFLPEYISWAETFIRSRPIPQMYVDLYQAYKAMGEDQKASDIFNRGKQIYPRNQAITKADEFLKQQAASQASATGNPESEAESSSKGGNTTINSQEKPAE